MSKPLGFNTLAEPSDAYTSTGPVYVRYEELEVGAAIEIKTVGDLLRFLRRMQAQARR